MLPAIRSQAAQQDRGNPPQLCQNFCLVLCLLGLPVLIQADAE